MAHIFLIVLFNPYTWRKFDVCSVSKGSWDILWSYANLHVSLNLIQMCLIVYYISCKFKTRISSVTENYLDYNLLFTGSTYARTNYVSTQETRDYNLVTRTTAGRPDQMACWANLGLQTPLWAPLLYCIFLGFCLFVCLTGFLFRPIFIVPQWHVFSHFNYYYYYFFFV